VHAAAERGIAGGSTALPYADQIQRAFGHHDIGNIQAHTDGAAAASAGAMGARAFATGDHVAFAGTPDLHTAAHEAAHVVQQRGSVQLKAGVSEVGDAYERHADQVADRVVAGESAQDLLDQHAPANRGFSGGIAGGNGPVQHFKDFAATGNKDSEGGIHRANAVTHVVQQAATAPRVMRAPLTYDNTSFRVTPPPASTDLAKITADVDAMKKSTPPAITGASIIGAAAKTNQAIFLYNVIHQIAAADRWGRVIHVVAPIDWPAKPGDPAPVGEITLTIDLAGNATAELLGTGPVARPTAYADRPAAEAALKTKYKISAVTDDGATWSVPELNLVGGAFGKLPSADLGALASVELKRVSTIPGGNAGQFGYQEDLPSGATAVTSSVTLLLANSAFNLPAAGPGPGPSVDDLQFIGAKGDLRPESYQVILHEVGHAIALRKLRESTHTAYAAGASSNAAAAAQTAANTALDPAVTDLNAKVGELNALADAYNKAAPADKKAAKADYDAKKAEVDAARAIYEPLKKQYDAAKKKADTAKADYDAKQKLADANNLPDADRKAIGAAVPAQKTAVTTAATAAAAAAAKYTPTDATDSDAYRTAVAEVTTGIDTYVTSTSSGTMDDSALDPLEATVKKLVDARDAAATALRKAAAANPALTDFARVSSAQDAWYEAARSQAHVSTRSKLVQNFVNVVNTAKIKPFTKYASDNWPFKPGEFYAEAFTIWQNNPKFLSDNYKPIYDFFTTGKYH
jgi:hypothetical protein